MEKRKKEKVRKHTKIFFPFNFFFSFFLFQFLWRFYVEKGYMWAVRQELASVRLVEVNKKRKNKADLGFLGVDIFVFHEKKSMEPDKRRERERCASALDYFLCFLFLTFFFGLMVARSEMMNREARKRGSRRRNISKGPEKTTLTVARILRLGLSIMPRKKE